MSVPFIKVPKSEVDQLQLLQSRGLKVDDTTKALSYLGNINYYRLSAYWYTFLDQPKTDHKFRDGTSFKQIIDTYVFDRRLRILIFDEIERIEISIKTRLIQEYTMVCGNNWYEDSAHFRILPSGPDLCHKFLEILEPAKGRGPNGNSPCVEHCANRREEGP